MDALGDWEILSDDGLFDFYSESPRPVNSKSKGVFQFEDYFSPDGSSVPTQIVPIPIRFDPVIGDDEEVTKLPIESSVVPSEKVAAGGEDAANNNTNNNQVSFVKMKETDQFVDMKMDSPKSDSKGSSDAGAYQFEDCVEAVVEGKEAVAGWEEEGGGVNLWKWGLSGIGALCSFGMAAATVCIVVLGSQQRKQHEHQQKRRFQIYASDKRIKQVVHQANRLNEVITGRRGGLQLATAHITYGGYYDAL